MPTFNNPQDPNTPLFVTRSGRLLTNYDLDLAAGHSYSIDNTAILSLNTLGVTVINSNLRSVGTLNSLEVEGDSLLAGFAFFNSSLGRVGLGTDEPVASIDIIDNNVQITIGSPEVNLATIGTHSNHNLAITTDNQARISIANTGEITIPGDLTIHGTLTVDNVITDSRVDRGHSLQFVPNLDSTVYGLGLVWSATDRPREMLMMSGPDRLWTTESFDIAEGKSYHINGQPVLSSTELGSSVVSSQLSSVGILTNLSVAGNIHTSTISFNDNLSINNNGLFASSFLQINSQFGNLLFGDESQITVGDITKQSRPVRIFGLLSVNVNNPDPTLELQVNGDVNLGGKRFTTGVNTPTTGTFAVGDICWNTDPNPNGYIGWVCIVPGNPGQWSPFGQIASQ
jgi:hypothetical protein